MMIAVIKLPDEPIIIVKSGLSIEAYIDNINAINARTTQYLLSLTGPLYRIVDLSLIDPSYADILLWLEEQKENRPGSVCDPRICPVAVGDHPMIPVGIKLTKKRLNIDIPLFSSLDEALAFARTEIAKNAPC